MTTKALLLGGLLTSVAATPALGQSMYFGASAGESDLDVSGFDNETGWKVYGGYRFNDWFAGQASYIDLGKFDSNNTPARVEIDGFELAAIGKLPLTPQLGVFGKLGAFAWNTDAFLLDDQDDIDASYGVGGEYLFPNQIGVRVEMERFADVGGEDVDLISAGVTFDF